MHCIHHVVEKVSRLLDRHLTVLVSCMLTARRGWLRRQGGPHNVHGLIPACIHQRCAVDVPRCPAAYPGTTYGTLLCTQTHSNLSLTVLLLNLLMCIMHQWFCTVVQTVPHLSLPLHCTAIASQHTTHTTTWPLPIDTTQQACFPAASHVQQAAMSTGPLHQMLLCSCC